MTADRVLDVRDLSVRFGKTVVLQHLSFSVERGRTLAILGPNAAGKTVLFRALIEAIPYDGTVQWADGTRIGYVPQKLDLERDVPITGVDFLCARAALVPRAVGSRKRTRQAREATVSRALDLVGVSQPAASTMAGWPLAATRRRDPTHATLLASRA